MFNGIIQAILDRREIYEAELAKSKQYIKTQHGKRIRSILYYMCGGGQRDDPVYHRTIAIIEDIHSATLIHDDVIDNNSTRRNGRSQYAEYGVKYSILLGDRLLIRSIRDFMELHSNSSYIRRIFIRECEATAYGAILEQNMNNSKSSSIDEYIRMAYLKTAPFFKLCCLLGALLSNDKFNEAKELAIIGICLGIIFQVQNDLDSYKSENFQCSEDYVMKNVSFPIVLLSNCLNYNIEAFKKETNQEQYSAICQAVTSQEFIDISHDILKKYINRCSEFVRRHT
ncbi:MAG: polyprenyl synthetase family protein [Holosporales bacterium]|jgi:geranylgeranyl pyrophosphate synthase|nr:polyprenyl synthetase family protein [Holosporales bacterium]